MASSIPAVSPEGSELPAVRATERSEAPGRCHLSIEALNGAQARSLDRIRLSPNLIARL
jgi:hypothetical protein